MFCPLGIKTGMKPEGRKLTTSGQGRYRMLGGDDRGMQGFPRFLVPLMKHME